MKLWPGGEVSLLAPPLEVKVCMTPDTQDSPKARPSLTRALEPIRRMLTPALLTLLIFQIFSGMLISPLLTLFPVYVEKHLHLNTVFSANIRVLTTLAGGVVALAGGAICDALGRKPSFLLAMTGIVSAGLIFLVPSQALMVPLAIYSGLMFGLGTVAGLTYVMETTPRESLALATASYFLTGTLGNALGSAGSGWIAKELPNGYAVLGAAMSGGHLLLLGVAALLLPALPRPETPRTVEAILGGYGALLRRREIVLLLGLRFLPTVYWGSVTFLMSLLLVRATGSEVSAGNYTAVSLVISAICQFSMGRLVDAFGVRVPALVAISLVTVAAFGQGLLGHWVVPLVGFGLLGAGAAWAMSVTMTTLVQEFCTEETRAKLLGLTHVAWSGGFVTGNYLGGFFGKTLGAGPTALLIGAGCCAIAVLCAIVVMGALPKREAV